MASVIARKGSGYRRNSRTHHEKLGRVDQVAVAAHSARAKPVVPVGLQPRADRAVPRRERGGQSRARTARDGRPAAVSPHVVRIDSRPTAYVERHVVHIDACRPEDRRCAGGRANDRVRLRRATCERRVRRAVRAVESCRAEPRARRIRERRGGPIRAARARCRRGGVEGAV